MDREVIELYTDLASVLGMGKLWMSIDAQGYVDLEWHPTGRKDRPDDRCWRETISLEMVWRAPRGALAHHVGNRMREAHRATVADARRLAGNGD